MNLKNIIIAEDHKVVMMGTTEMLTSLYHKVQITGVPDFSDLLIQLKKESYDLLILDINIPGGDNLNMIQKIKRVQPDMRILMFSGYVESLFAFPYLQAGADGFLSKNSGEQELKLAIDRIMSNQKYLSHAMQQQSIEKIIRSNISAKYGLNVLSTREMEIMNLLMQGASTSEIGLQLYLQVSTVSTHKMKILKKLQVRNVVEMIAYVKSIQHPA